MRKIINQFVLWGAIFAMASLCYAQDATYNTKVYKDNNGDRLNVASGGSVTVYSGGQIEIQSGGSINLLTGGLLKSAGTTIFGSGTVLAVSNGGTAGTTSANARTNLGVVSARVSIPASGSSTIATGLTTVSYAVPGLYVLDSDHGGISLSWSGGNVIITQYAIGSTTVSTSVGTATYIAVGTP